jgi:hypothetical protein
LIIDEKENSELESKETSHFFYVDDFFHWLGCKFVTCDKENMKELDREKDKERKKEKDKANSVITITDEDTKDKGT